MSNRKENYDLSPANDSERTTKPLLDQSGSPTGIAYRGADDTDCTVIVRDPGYSGQEVKDSYNVIYLIFLLFGIACLLPWNIFITVTPYFVDFKLNVTEAMNESYRNDFTYYVGNVGQLTNVLMNLINILVSFGGNPKNRIPYTIVLSSVVVLFHAVLAVIDSSTWPYVFFVVCCASVFVMYVATGIMNSCVYYVAAIFPMEYMSAIVLGNNFAGIFTTVMSIVSKATSPNLQIAAIIYFLSAFVVLMATLAGYFFMHKTKYYRYRNSIAEDNKKRALENSNSSSNVPYFYIIKKTWLLLFCIWLNFFSTLAVFPVYQLGVKRSSDSFIISEFWFQDVVTFLTFNVLVAIGNMIPRYIKSPGPRWIAIPVILRAILHFAFFAVCNFKPELRENSIIPVLITNDYVYWAGCIITPILFGHFTSLLMMYTPSIVPEHSGSTAMIAALVLTIGVTTGLQFSKILELIVLA